MSAYWALAGLLLVGCAPAEWSTSDPANDKSDQANEAWRRYDQYLRAHGIVLEPAALPVVLAVRGFSTDGTHHDTAARAAYDDLFVVLSASHQVYELPGSTHPWQQTSKAAWDADGDGTGDVGMVRPGRYRASARPPDRDIGGMPTYHVRTWASSEKIPGWRDTNHDGVLSSDEREQSERRDDLMTGILFHRGGPGTPDAIGCQVMAPETLELFVTAVGGRAARFHYYLADADQWGAP